MITSTYSFIFISSFTYFLSVSEINITASSHTPALISVSLIISTSFILELMESLPPRSITAFPDLNVSPKASTVTFGRDSYIIAITPSGTFLYPIIRPLGRCFIEVISPTGSSSATSCLNPSAIPSILASVSVSLSISAGFMPFLTASSTSALLAFLISSAFFISSSATISRTSFFFVILNFAICLDAAFALFPNTSNDSIFSSKNT